MSARYPHSVRNSLLVISWFLAFGLAVFTRESYLDDDIAVLFVSAGLVISALVVWVVVAQSYRGDEGGLSEPQSEPQ